MTPERYAEVRNLFDQAADLPRDEQDAFVGAAAAGDSDLAEEVRALLASADDTARLDRIVARAAAATADSDRGRRYGAYRLLEPLGEGGMGSVWLAERADDEFHHRVAIKRIHPELARGALLEQFRIERQILADLEHPNIARLLDGGSAPDGSPYLVMEFVEGERITVACDRRSLSVRERIGLFLPICGAVEHAHRRLIVHRDLKPSNLLLTAAGEPKLLDFGIAKLLPRDVEGPGGDATRLGIRLLTLDYASPEQILGRPITTASDVYSLGVVLFELLAGAKPQRLEGLSALEIERRLAAESPTRASVAVTPEAAAARASTLEGLARRLRGDLDTILAKALQADPARRYSSVEGLADDLRNHLLGLPVAARPDRWGYRAGKYVRRHPFGVAAAALAGVALAAFLVALALQAARLERERDRALAAEREAQSVSGFLTELFETADPNQAPGEVTARDLLDRGARTVESDLAAEPRVEAALLATMGTAYRGLGLRDRGIELLSRSLALRERTFGPHHLETALSLNRLGDALRQTSRLREAEPLLRRALAIRLAQLPADDVAVAETENDLALVLTETGRTSEAEAMLRRAIAIREAALGPNHPSVAASLTNLALLCDDLGRSAEAESTLRRVLALRRRNLRPDHPQIGGSLHTLGNLLARRGERQEGERLLRAAVALRGRSLGESHPDFANSINSLASVLQDDGRPAEAEPLYRRALALAEARSGDARREISLALNNLGSLLEDRGRFDEAEPLFRRSLALRLDLLGPDHAAVARARHNLGRLEVKMGQVTLGERDLEEALAWRRKHLEPDHPDVAATLFQLAAVARLRGDLSGALARVEEALAIQLRKLPADSPAIEASRSEIASLEARLGSRGQPLKP